MIRLLFLTIFVVSSTYPLLPNLTEAQSLHLPSTGQIKYTTLTGSLPWVLKEDVMLRWIALVDTYGGSYESVGISSNTQGQHPVDTSPWDIVLFKFGNPNGGVVMFDGYLHGTEFYTEEVLYYVFLWLLSSGDANATRILNNNYILVIPCINYRWARSNYASPSWMTGIDPPDGNEWGVNLNRVFAPSWYSGGATDQNGNYNGGSPDNANEAQALIGIWNTYAPRIYWNLHQGSSPMTQCTARTTQSTNDATAVRNLLPSIQNALGVTGGWSFSVSTSYGTGYAKDGAAYRGSAGFMTEVMSGWDNSQTKKTNLDSGNTFKQVKAMVIAMAQVVEIEGTTPVTVTISQPTNTTYAISTIPVQYSAVGGTIDQMWFNIRNASAWIYAENQTYTYSTEMTEYVNGTSYKLYAWANNTEGTVGEKTVMFSVAIPPPPSATVDLTIFYPQNILHTSSSIAVQLSATGGTIDVIWYNCKNASVWVYVLNLTYTAPTSMTGFADGSYTFYAWANNTLGDVDAKTVGFTVYTLSEGRVTIVSSGFHFGLIQYHTYINFQSEVTFSTIHRESDYWYFDGYGFQVQNANMTITYFFEYFKFTLVAASGVSVTKIYVYDRGCPTNVIGEESWSYDTPTKIVTINVVHSSSQDVEVQWGDLDTESPTYTNVAHNTTIAGQPCLFSAKWTDNVALDTLISSTNITGSWVNETVSFSGNPVWANVTKTLPSSGTKVGYRWYAKDTSNNWGSSSIYTLTTTSVNTNVVVLLNTPGDGSTDHVNTQSFTFSPIFFQDIQNASLWLNLTGTWQSVALNSSVVTNSTLNTISYMFSVSATYFWNIGVYNSTTVTFSEANRTLIVSLEPYYDTQSYGNTMVSSSTTFSSHWRDGDGLAGFILCWNGSSSWFNETWVAWSGSPVDALAYMIRNLPATPGINVGFRFYVNDTDGKWASSTPTYLLTVVSGSSSFDSSFSLSVMVQSERGIVANAKVSVVDFKTVTVASKFSDKDGKASFSGLARGLYDVVVESEQGNGFERVNLDKDLSVTVIVGVPSLFPFTIPKSADEFVLGLGQVSWSVANFLWMNLATVAFALLGFGSVYYGRSEDDNGIVVVGVVLLCLGVGFYFLPMFL